MVVETIQSSPAVAAALSHLSSFSLGRNLEIRLSLPFYFFGLFYCFGMSFPQPSSLDTVLLFVLLTFDLEASPWVHANSKQLEM